MLKENNIVDVLTRNIAKVGYESQFETKWKDLANNDINKVVWLNTAKEIMLYFQAFGEHLEKETEKQDKIILTK